MVSLSGPPKARCKHCGDVVMFDGYIRNPKGVCIILNPDYSIHSCTDITLTSLVLEQKTVRHLNSIVSRLGSGMKHYRIKLVVEEIAPDTTPEILEPEAAIRDRFVVPVREDKPYTPEQRLLMLTRM